MQPIIHLIYFRTIATYKSSHQYSGCIVKIANSDLTSLSVFRAVVEHRSFLGAQVAFGLSQSAVSFHIKAIEQRVGFRLCRRGSGGFELPGPGALGYEPAQTPFFRTFSVVNSSP